jgi:hypothetical protein
MKVIKGWEKALLNELSEQVEKYGFDKRVRGQSFYKQTSFGRLALHVSFIEHDDKDFDVTADVAVRFDELEDLLNEYKDHLSEAEKKSTFSLGAELGNISEDKQKRWTVAGVADVETASRSIMDAFSKIGIPYLEKHSNAETALKALSGDDRAAWLHAPIHGERAKGAIGLAFLLGDREKFFQIATAKTAFLTSRNDFDLQSFLKVKEALEHRLAFAVVKSEVN